MTYNSEYVMEEKITKDCNGLFVCPFCHESFRALCYHTRQVHGTDAKKLRLMFGLPLNYQLQVPDLRKTRSKWALKYKMDEQLKTAGKQTRFNKGRKLNKEEVHAIRRGHMKRIRLVEGM